MLIRIAESAWAALLECAAASVTAAAAAERLLATLAGPSVIALRLDLPPPFPASSSWGRTIEEREALAQVALPTTEVLTPADEHWPAALLPQGQLAQILMPQIDGALVCWLNIKSSIRLPSSQLRTQIVKLLQAIAAHTVQQGQLGSSRQLQEALFEIGALLDIAQLQTAVINVARRLFHCQHAWFLAYDEAHGLYTPDIAAPQLPEPLLPIVEAGLFSPEAQMQPSDDGLSVLACSAVRVGTQPLGMLLLQRDTALTSNELAMLEVLSLGIGQGLRNARIYQDSQETYDELRNALDQLLQAERLSALGEIARGVAHDFNNLLTIISSHTQFLLDDATAEQREELDQIQQAVREGIETVNRLREFTRAATNSTTLLVSLDLLVLEAHQLIQPLLQRLQLQRNIEIDIELNLTEHIEVPGNPSELRELMMHMLHNALDALPEGGTVEIRLWEDYQIAYLTIRDNGVGMAEDVRRRIFDPFFTTKALRGTGLGLSVVYGIVRRHGGTINVESQPGQGSTFTIQLPRTRGMQLAEN